MPSIDLDADDALLPENAPKQVPQVAADIEPPKDGQSRNDENGEVSSTIDVYNCTIGNIQKIFGISREAIRQWTIKGCPRNKSGSYSLIAVVEWREGQLRGRQRDDPQAQAERDRLKLTNELLELKVSKMRDETIPRIEAEQLAQSQAIAMRVYLTDSWKMRGPQICKMLGMAPNEIQKMYSVFDKLIEESIDCFCEAAELVE